LDLDAWVRVGLVADPDELAGGLDPAESQRGGGTPAEPNTHVVAGPSTPEPEPLPGLPLQGNEDADIDIPNIPWNIAGGGGMNPGGCWF